MNHHSCVKLQQKELIMPNIIINHNNRPLTLYKPKVSLYLTSYTVLVSDSWDYIEMYLKRKNQKKAIFFGSKQKLL